MVTTDDPAKDILNKPLIPSVGEDFHFHFSGMRFALPMVQSCSLTIIMSSERPSENKPMHKIARSLQGNLSSLFVMHTHTVLDGC